MPLAQWLVGLVLLLGIQPAPGAPPPKSLAQARAEAKPLVEANCGKCHSKSSPKVMPRALAVFDADRADWAGRLTKAQFSFALERFKGVGATPADLEIVSALFAAEIASR